MGTGRLNMKRSTCSAVAEQRRGSRNFATRVCLCLTVFLVLGAVSASAQSTAVPPTNAIQILGVSPTSPAPSNPPTAPVGGIILYGSQISNITNQPVRHLWVGDTNFGLCRMDPDLDAGLKAIADAPAGSPSPFSLTVTTCPFKLNGLSVTGGPMAFDPLTNKLYLTDEQTNAEAILRIGYLPTGDNGQGTLDLASLFSMTGNITGSRLSGGTTGCPFPIDSTAPAAPAGGVAANQLGRPNVSVLGPDGNLYVGFKKTGGIIRINNPATADVTGFGTCDDFVQLVAATPNRGRGNGLAFIGSDLWGSDTVGPFVIKNATTTCQALSQVPPQNPTCPFTRPTNATFAALVPADISSDQTYPYSNGNNLYMGDATDAIWVGNISAGGNAVVVRDPFEPVGAFVLNGNATINVGAAVPDMTDPANVTMFSGDDPLGAALLGQGRWWYINQNPPKAGKPSPVTVVRATAVNNTITVNWSPAQTGETVLSYTVHASTVPAGVVVADKLVTPVLGGKYPPNVLVIPGLPNGTYAFRVIANNASGNNGLNPTPSNTVTLPAIAVPLIPTNVLATAGDTVAFVNFAAPPNAAAYAITGYQITSIPAGGVSPVLPATATSGTVTGLTNLTSYTFTVHAINAGGISMESTPSNAVTPSAQPKVTIALTAPVAEPSVPVQATFTATVTNNTATAVTATGLTFTLSQATPDGANVVVALAGQGTCTSTAAAANCNIGTLAAGATVTVNVIVNIINNSVTGTATFNATDVAANPVTGTSTFNIATPQAPPQGGPGPTVAVLVSGSSAKPSMNKLTATTHTFTASNTTSTVVDNVTFTISEPALLTIGTITAISSQPALGTVTCAAPTPNVLNGIAVNNIVCSIAHLGGNLKGGTPLTAPQSITITVGITAPNQALTSTVQGVVAFNGTDGVTPVATFTQTVK